MILLTVFSLIVRPADIFFDGSKYVGKVSATCGFGKFFQFFDLISDIYNLKD